MHFIFTKQITKFQSSVCEQCENILSGYLGCIKGELDTDYKGLEDEFNGDFQRLARSCFSNVPV
jgi:hypothetical protein